jgi:hypothetical protein
MAANDMGGFPPLDPGAGGGPGSQHWGTIIGIGIGDVLQRPNGMWALLAALISCQLLLILLSWIKTRR